MIYLIFYLVCGFICYIIYYEEMYNSATREQRLDWCDNPILYNCVLLAFMFLFWWLIVIGIRGIEYRDGDDSDNFDDYA